MYVTMALPVKNGTTGRDRSEMYIKRLELIGFKSFADRTEIELAPGITAVVGPNGSGKSNIAECLRWVLGEQSAKSLRGSRMEDVIFAGSDSRKPINFCEVSLTLDNRDGKLPLDYQEITVTRRLYRSGESEYSINRQSCRLKDVVDLFMDTGLGKEAYSMIGQGRIDEVLSNRPEDRRGIFEEAAGIVKYKTRKREALKKLEDTRANLVRVDDIIHELREQIAPLAEDADRERAYRALRDQAYELEGRLAVLHIENVYRDFQEVEQSRADAEREAAAARAEVDRWDAVLQEKRLILARAERELEEYQEQWAERRAQHERDEGRLRVLEERLTHFEKSAGEMRERERSLLAGRAEWLEEADRLRREVEEAERLVEEHERRLGEGPDGGTEEERERELLESRKSDLIDLLNRAASARNEYRHLLETREAAAARKARAEQEVRRLSAELEETDSRIRDMDAVRESLQSQMARLQEEHRELARRGEALERELRDLEARWRRDREQLAGLSSKLEVMKELEDSYGGYGRGVKAVLQAGRSGGLSGICGAVAELIEVPAGLEAAVETALGPALQYVVVEHEEDGRRAIEYLKSSGEGRITCIPLSVVRERRLAPEDRRVLETSAGWIGVAADLIRCDPLYRPAVGNLLGQVVVARDLRSASEMARRTRYRFRVVTLDGDVVHPGGAMSGGAPARSGSNLLSRRRQLEEVRRKVDGLRRTVEEGGKRVGDLEEEQRRLALLREEIERQMGELAEEIRRKERERADLTSAARSLRERLEWNRLELEQSEAEIRDRESSLRKTEAAIEAAERAVAEAQEDIERRRLRVERLQAEAESLRAARTELRVRLASLRERHLYLREQEAERRRRLAALEAELADLRRTLARLEEDARKAREEREAVSVRLAQSRGENAAWALRVEEARNRRRRAAEEVQEAEARLGEARERLRRREEHSHGLAVRRERLQVELRHALDALAENFRMGYERARERFAPVEDPGPLQERLRVLRAEMDALGPVRTGAIEEYERLRDRLNFLERQRADLLTAADRLDEVVRDIDAEMSQRFLQTVEAVNRQFQDVFSKLFGGGRAYLQLTDPQDPLGTGVEIAAQPPGKKLQTLSLLSGGERALTAIALLFAILKVNPVPVCVLDEVDAALDEANVQRFARYLREFSNETQFVVITHRKGTMEQADALYGVAMEEAGVSKMVAVRLVDPEPEKQTAS